MLLNAILPEDSGVNYDDHSGKDIDKTEKPENVRDLDPDSSEAADDSYEKDVDYAPDGAKMERDDYKSEASA